MRTHAIRFHEIGGPEKLIWEEVEVGEPGQGEILLRQTAIGLNYIDTYHRNGLYPVPCPRASGSRPRPWWRKSAPASPSSERATALPMPPHRSAPMRNGASIPPPARSSCPRELDQQGAAMMLQGMTVEYLIRRTFRVMPGQYVLFHAAAGGVGLIACQWLRHIGAIVIGTAGGPEKMAMAMAHGRADMSSTTAEDVAQGCAS